MKNFLPQNWSRFYLTRLSIALMISFLFFFFKNNTSGVFVSDHGVLICPKNIEPQKASDITDYTLHFAPSEGLSVQICTFDSVFNGSDSDRIHLVDFSDNILESPFVMRHDIAQHFYKKIIAAHPDDALSLYLQTYKTNH